MYKSSSLNIIADASFTLIQSILIQYLSTHSKLRRKQFDRSTQKHPGKYIL